jgi:putative hydrolase
MDPADALERIAYLLDRSLADARKASAFHRATEIVRETPAEELQERAKKGTLTELKGIGDSTGSVISDALAGQVPKRLQELEATTEIPLGEGAEMRRALKGDCHTHSTWSDGGASIETMASTAIALGHEYMVLTDHSPRLTVAHGLTAERLREQLDEVRRLNDVFAPFRILTGIEVDILADGALDQEEDMLAQLDVVVASVHSKLSMERSAMTERMVVAVASPHVDILGHCTGRKVRGFGDAQTVVRPQATFDPEIVFAACARFDTAVEINCRPERQDPPDELLEIALEWGCKISIDTDAHAPGQLEWQNYGCDKAARHEIDPADVVNTWAAKDLVAWTGTHPSA